MTENIKAALEYAVELNQHGLEIVTAGDGTDELIRMKEAEARLKHGWVEVQTTGDVITNKGD
ncbi:hypothetical protein [Streptococcus suis]|uniref:hypothetical protein n=1 Tax=Streptococcus suis TaxID=1307 RepID=UPI000CF5D2D4|nr:hypothetical protein [Streptococcus suis]MDW8739682.1 hypothetical protein [Streptococcus suis]